ncbi:MAG: hypothetical protein AB8I08_28170 [Sandaracinaceae bacterium]
MLIHRRSLGLFSALLLASCGGGAGTPGAPAADSRPSGSATAAAPAAQTGSGSDENEAAPPADTGDIPFWDGGAIVRRIDRATAEAEGLTLLDLGDEATPRIFTEDPSMGRSGRQAYRENFIRLANEEDRDASRDVSRGYLELYGIFPTFHVLRQRLADDERHTCHDAVDDEPIGSITRSLRPGHNRAAQRRTANRARYLRNRLERQARRARVETIDELADDRRWGRELTRLHDLENQLAAIRSVQQHLECEGHLSRRAQEGVFDGHTGAALRGWQSKNMIISLASQLDEASRVTLQMDSREIDFLSLLRSLRERVGDASGIIEDGTASNDWGTVLGRQLQVDEEFRWVDRLDPLENGAPDLLSPATEAAAVALGWTDPAAARAWLDEHHGERVEAQLVAVRLPPVPDYHSDQMDLRVEIDRGDVWYQFPYTDDGRPRGFPVRNRPMTTIFVRHQGREIPLVRYNTTIGSWQPEVNPEGGVGMRYKESDVGQRVWRDIIAGPAWLPPPSTPDDELLRRRGSGWRVHRQITGPGYDSAYGLTMVIHHIQNNDGAEESDYVDRGIRSHGSVSYRSILRGYSHGCHRLFNHLAVRMNSFLLAHRNHTVRGAIPAQLRRELHPPESEEVLMLEIDQRGFLFQLDPPVPVEVLRGNVRGRPSRPMLGFFPLPEDLQAQAAEEAAADPSVGEAPAAVTP